MPCAMARHLTFGKRAIARAAVLVFLLGAASVAAQERLACGSATDDTAQALDKLLTNDPTCAAAHKRLLACMWGSSADVQFASIVIKKCLQTFLPKFSPEEKSRFYEEIQICNYQYARAEGTLAISEESLCHADVTANFSAHPELARRPAPRASFGCAKANTLLERAICSDAKLGRADIILARVYKGAVNESPARERPALIASERKWLKSIPAKCKLSASAASPATLDCIRNAFELRFTALDGCSADDEGIAACADTPDDASPPPSPAP